ncbi:AAA family ATPase [Pseudomonas asplenii]|uniref:AAA family ATPase n=1 Tax=Pseudomonas asplenii TaxID=53407 RepID=UPI0006B5C3DF|nr:AAA family ATPase [Pseudomonas fuscovaginae]KPA94399.1 AAA domain [Pseudomonas fuscovaginae]
MLERIEWIRGIGLLHDVNGRALRFSKTQLIYADNGRGKSTLASILRSVAEGDSSALIDRKTVDGTIPPDACLAFGSGHKVTLTKGKWSEARPELLVFDAEFIEKNVHSGGVVSPGQRKNLLQFALGASAVQARVSEEKATKESSDANAEVSRLTAQLAGFHQGLSLPMFQKLTPMTEEEAYPQLNALRKRLLVTQSIDAVLKRALPEEIQEPSFDLDALFKILNLSLADVEENAEHKVSAHIAHQNNPSIERWISEGQTFDDGSACPYCSQPTTGVELVRAYRTHFNKEYQQLKSSVSMLERGVQARTADTVIEKIATGVANACTAIALWLAEVKIDNPVFSIEQAKIDIQSLRETLTNLVSLKLNRPLESIGSIDEKLGAHKQWNTVLEHIRKANSKILLAQTSIIEFRESLISENPDLINQEITNLELRISRNKQNVAELLTALAGAKKKSQEAETNKKLARATLNEQMASTLATFNTTINKILSRFGASFSIEKMDANFRGGLRSEYGISLRGRSITLDGTPKFATALSEGDKRTLAFAFYIATVTSDPELEKKIIVIDDPMCSLDANRKSQTKEILRIISTRAEQLIIMAHDPFFVRDLKEALAVQGSPALEVFQLQHAADGYSQLVKFNVEQECESTFYRHHRLLMEFCSGTAHDSRPVAKAIRPFLEGYLHRRFPGLVPKDLMFGQILSHIGTVSPSNPLAYAAPLVEELRDLNSYAGQFHHDTNPGVCETIPITTSELITYSQRALNVVYRGAV